MSVPGPPRSLPAFATCSCRHAGTHELLFVPPGRNLLNEGDTNGSNAHRGLRHVQQFHPCSDARRVMGFLVWRGVRVPAVLLTPEFGQISSVRHEICSVDRIEPIMSEQKLYSK